MSKRYGRNQKRRAREREAELEALLQGAHSSCLAAMAEARIVRQRLHSAKAEALTEYVNQKDLLEIYLKEIGREMGRVLGKELEPHARRLLAAQDRQLPPLRPSLDAILDNTMVTDVILRGEVPPLRYCVILR